MTPRQHYEVVTSAGRDRSPQASNRALSASVIRHSSYTRSFFAINLNSSPSVTNGQHLTKTVRLDLRSVPLGSFVFSTILRRKSLAPPQHFSS